MRIIKEIVKEIKSEIKNSENYINRAIKEESQNKELADLYYSLSNEELQHAYKLHDQVVNEINKYKKTGKEVPEVMLELWDWQHSEFMEEVKEIKIMIEMYKG